MTLSYAELVAKAKAQIREVSTSEVAARLDDPPVILDVREPDEVRLGTIPGAILLPLGQVESGVAATVADPDTEVVVLHVLGGPSLPLFSDQPQHEAEVWTREFLARFCPCPDDVRLEVRVGLAEEAVLRVAAEVGADLVKAATAMARGAVSALDGLPVTGVMVSPEPATVPGLQSVVGEHPVPGPGSLRAGRLLLEVAGSAGRDDLVLVLLSGGGSSLAEVPLPGCTLADLQAVGAALLRSGLPITAVNTVRRHLSGLKGGRLALGGCFGRK